MQAFDKRVVYVPAYVSHGFISKDGATLISATTEGFKKNEVYNQIETFYQDYDWDQWLDA